MHVYRVPDLWLLAWYYRLRTQTSRKGLTEVAGLLALADEDRRHGHKTNLAALSTFYAARKPFTK